MRGESSSVTEMSRSASQRASSPVARFAPGPEVTHLVDAVAALLDDDAEGARWALDDAVAASSWPAVEHRVEVVGRALVADAELEPARGPHPDAVHVEGDESDDRRNEERRAAVLTGLQVIARLIDRAGYPPEVLA